MRSAQEVLDPIHPSLRGCEPPKFTARGRGEPNPQKFRLGGWKPPKTKPQIKHCNKTLSHPVIAILKRFLATAISFSPRRMKLEYRSLKNRNRQNPSSLTITSSSRKRLPKRLIAPQFSSFHKRTPKSDGCRAWTRSKSIVGLSNKTIYPDYESAVLKQTLFKTCVWHLITDSPVIFHTPKEVFWVIVLSGSLPSYFEN